MRIAYSLALAVILSFPGPSFAADIVVATWNLEWFFDHDASDDSSNIGPNFAAPNEAEFTARVTGIAKSIATLKPTIMALQEVENAKVVKAIRDELKDAHSLEYDVGFVQGKDTQTGQDVAVLVKKGLPVEVKRFDFTPFTGDPEFKNLSKHLVLRTTIDRQQFTIVTVHLITRLNQRIRQARTLHAWLEDLIPPGQCHRAWGF